MLWDKEVVTRNLNIKMRSIKASRQVHILSENSTSPPTPPYLQPKWKIKRKAQLGQQRNGSCIHHPWLSGLSCDLLVLFSSFPKLWGGGLWWLRGRGNYWLSLVPNCSCFLFPLLFENRGRVAPFYNFTWKSHASFLPLGSPYVLKCHLLSMNLKIQLIYNKLQRTSFLAILPWVCPHDHDWTISCSQLSGFKFQSFRNTDAYVSYIQVKFHIISYHHLHRSCGTANATSMSHLNVEQLMKALTTLFSLYEANRASHSMCQNEAEFYSLYLLLHLDSDNRVMHGLLNCLLTRSIYWFTNF